MGTPQSQPQPEQPLAALADPAGLYRRMGLVTGSGQIPFVGCVRLLAGNSPDTAIVVVALSLQDRQLAFQRAADGFAAEYHVDIAVRRGDTVVRAVARDERVVAGTLRETLGGEEGAIFQQFIRVPAGEYTLAIELRDAHRAAVGRYEAPLTVPSLVPPAIATPVPVYQVARRTDRAAQPDLLVNPRSLVEYGTDTARFYVETYDLPPGSTLVTSAIDAAGSLAWADTTRLDTTGAVRAVIVSLPPSRFPMGQYDLRVAVAGGAVVADAPFLVGFSGQWIVADWDQMVSLLRYFTSADTLRALATAPPDQRASAWSKFYHDTDPNKTTPVNEALDRYLARVAEASERFRDEGVPGWLTDRGEVLITLGEPDQVVDGRNVMTTRGRTIVWGYTQLRLTLYFVDISGFGRYRLDPESRADFVTIVNRLRRSP